MTRKKELPEPVEPEPIEDFSGYKEGDVFPKLKKKIHFLFVNGGDYIVFLDEQLILHRYYNSVYAGGGLPEGYGEIVVRHANLEATSTLLLKELQLEVFRKLLGESIARVIEDRDSKNARRMLRNAEVFLKARSRERAIFWYLSAAMIATALLLAGGLRAWAYRESVAAALGFSEGVVDLLLGAAVGSFGALLSVLLRSKDLCIDFSAGRFVHFFEGTLRMLVGAAAGFVFALAIKSNVLVGSVNNSEKSLPIMLLICIIAGASERLLPSLIKQLEGTLVGHVGKTKLEDEEEEEEEETEETEETEEELEEETEEEEEEEVIVEEVAEDGAPKSAETEEKANAGAERGGRSR
jgi:hypothetical protein